ncbi:hypothetical protein [Acidovorax lacteus]
MSRTRELVRARWGDQELEALRPVLRAVTARLIHARIHFQDYQRLVDEHLRQPLEAGTPWWDLMWMDEEKGIGASNYFFVAAEGYVYASVQAQHAIADNLAHVLYYSLGWNVDQRIPLGKVSLGTVCAQLAREATTVPELAPIQQALAALSSAPAYQALADVTNHIKHHGGLPVRVGWSVSERTPFEVLLSAFSRKQQAQPPREIAAFLDETYDTMSRAVVTTGLALNEWLESSVASTPPRNRPLPDSEPGGQVLHPNDP